MHQREGGGGNSVQVELSAMRHALLRERGDKGIIFILLAEKNVAIDALKLLPCFIVGVDRNRLAHHGVVAAHFIKTKDVVDMSMRDQDSVAAINSGAQTLLAVVGRNIDQDHARLTSGDAAIEAAAARAWCLWEDTIATLLTFPPSFNEAALRSLARIETHYFLHQAFLVEGELITNAPRLRGIPGIIVQGRYDMVTPPATAWSLHEAWPGSTLRIVPDAGHASSEPGIRRELIAATDTLYAKLSQQASEELSVNWSGGGDREAQA